MKSVLIVVGAATAAAQLFSGQPSCATPCISAAITQVGCALSDISCQCNPTSSAAIGNAGLTCLLSNCNAAQLGQAQSAGAAACSSLSAGQLTTASSTSATGAATTSPSMSMTSPATTATSTGSSLVPTLSHSGNTVISDTSSPASKTLTGTVVSPTASGSTLASAGTSAAATTTTTSSGAAPTAEVAKAVGGILAGMVGILAAL